MGVWDSARASGIWNLHREENLIDSPLEVGRVTLHWRYLQGSAKRLRPGLVNMRRKKLRSPACCRQENAIFSPHVHQTWPKPFSGALYTSAHPGARPRRLAAHGQAAGVPRRAQPVGDRVRRTGRGAVPCLSGGRSHQSDCGLRPRLPLALSGAVPRDVLQLPNVSHGLAVKPNIVIPSIYHRARPNEVPGLRELEETTRVGFKHHLLAELIQF